MGQISSYETDAKSEVQPAESTSQEFHPEEEAMEEDPGTPTVDEPMDTATENTQIEDGKWCISNKQERQWARCGIAFY